MKSDLAIHGGLPSVSRNLLAFNSIGSLEKEAVLEFLDSNALQSGFHGSARPSFFGGEQVKALEQAWSKRFGVKYSISVNSATSGLMAAMGAIGISPGDEVIVPAYSMSASALAPLIYGGIPIFVDIEDQYYCLDVDKVLAAITPATKAIIVVNLFGHPAELRRLKEIADQNNLFLIEDNAQAILAEENCRLAGTVGHIGVYSLNVHKHIQVGEGGVCVTDDDQLALRLQLIRNHGENVIDWLNVEDLTNLVGFNFRMNEITAVMAKIQLSRVDELVERVELICERLSMELGELPGLVPPKVRPGCRHNYYMWSAQFDAKVVGTSREKFSQALNAEGFPNSFGYVKPIYRLPVFQKKVAIGREGFPFNYAGRRIDYHAGLCPATERMHSETLIQYQPVSWSADDEQVTMLIEAVQKVYKNAKFL